MSLWLVMIILHSISGVVCFFSGLAIISPDRVQKHRWLMPAFLLSLVGLIIFMIGAMISHWYEISSTEQIIFSGLVGLALYMLYRALRAKKLLQKERIPENYIDDIGFTLISLFNGFTIVALIDLGASIWIVILGAVIAAIAGARLIKQTKQRYTNTASE